jgi:hypothetical protein
MGLYYKIWVDAIVTERSKKVEARNWKLYTIIPISLLQGINLFTFFYWMKTIVNRRLPLFFPVAIFNAKLVNDFIAIVITLFIPFVILNYLLIFSYDKYEKLIPEYKSQSTKYYRKYTLITLGLLIIPIIIQKMFF